MASLTQRNGDGRKGWVLRFRTADSRERSLWLGPVSKRQAEESKRFLGDLLQARRIGSHPREDTLLWLKSLDSHSTIRKALVRLGLASSEQTTTIDPELRKLKPWLEKFISDMLGAARTRNNYEQTRDWLLKYFADDTFLVDITPAEMDRWVKYLKAEGLAYSNRSKHVQRCKRFFATAVDSRILDVSPAARIRIERKPTGQRIDRTRQFYVDRELTDRVLLGMPDANWRMLFALLRFQGMRRHEVFGLQWQHVDWSTGRFQIHSRKTGYRECPVFDETVQYLQAARQEAPEGAKRVIRGIATEESITPLLLKHVGKVLGVENVWPKICHQLRSTRRTELDDQFPSQWSTSGWDTIQRPLSSIISRLPPNIGQQRRSVTTPVTTALPVYGRQSYP